MRKIYLYHTAKDDKSQFFALLVNGKCFLFVLAPSRQNMLPNVKKMWHNRVAELMEEAPEHKLIPQNITFSTIQVENDEEILTRSLSKIIYTEKRGPTMLCYQTMRDKCPLRGVDDMPLVALPRLPKDEFGSEQNLDWQKTAAECFIQRMSVHLVEIEKLVEKARFYHLPIGNIPTCDAILYGGDVFFARHLTQSGHLLWCSPSPRPDLGGREKDLARLESDADELTPIYDKKGLFMGHTVQLSISGMPEAALLQSHNLTELDGFETFQQGAVDSRMKQDGQLHTNYAESTLAMPQYRIMKTMVAAWVREITHFNNVHADSQVQHLMRYITSSSSLLYDPALVKLLVSSIYRLFKLMTNELTRLGCTVVHAEPDKLVLCSNKKVVFVFTILFNCLFKTIQEAIAYADFIERRLVEKEYFQALDFKFESAWSILLWYNQLNHGGRRVLIENGELVEHDADDDENKTELSFKWLDYLPEEASIRKSMAMLISGYITMMHREMDKGKFKNSNNSITSVSTESIAKEELIEFARATIRGQLSEHLLDCVEKIRARFPPGAERSKKIFPRLAGSHLKLDNPALFYAKMAMEILSAHEEVEEEVRVLRNQEDHLSFDFVF